MTFLFEKSVKIRIHSSIKQLLEALRYITSTSKQHIFFVTAENYTSLTNWIKEKPE